MWIWCAAGIYLLSACVFLSYWIHGSKPPLPQLAVVLALAGLGGLAAGAVDAPRLPVALWLGGAGWILGGVMLKRGFWFQNTVTMLLFPASVMPLCRCEAVSGEYCMIVAGLLACVLLGVIDRLRHGELRAASGQCTAKAREILPELLPLFGVACAGGLSLGSEGLSFPAAAGCCVMLWGISGLLLALQDQIRQRIKLQLLNKALCQWQQESRDYLNTIRSQRHDFNLHLHAISGLINSKQYTKCGEYVQKLVAEAAAVNDIMPVADAVVGSMLYNMREQARRKGSDIIYQITHDMEDVVCNGFECNKIIGNLLQNAIDALQTPEDLRCGIHASIFKRRGYTVIAVENRFTGDKNAIVRAFEPGFSTKQRHEGIGLAMVLRTVEQYAGRVYPEFEEDRIRFIVNIPNRVALKEREEPEI